MTTFLLIYALGWIGFSSFVTLALSDEQHPRPRQQVLAIIGFGALWPLWTVVGVWMFITD